MSHNHLHHAHARAAEQVVSVIYVTAAPTFTGAIGGYSTMGVDIDTDEPDPATPTPTSPSKTSRSTTLATSILPAGTTSPALTPIGSILAATGSLSSSPAFGADSSTATSPSSSSDDNNSGGLSAGATAGLVVGILVLVGALLSIVLFCIRKRRKTAQEAAAREDEKTETGIQPSASERSTVIAPRLSLRPITQFLPNLAEKRASRGNPVAAQLAPVSEGRPTTAQSNEAENPFGNHAETVDSVQNPFGPHAETIDATNAKGPVELENTPEVAVAVPLAAPISLKRGASKRENGPANSPVHRVQLDFNPSLSDELELKQGQLVRVLHEYDDGWALCIRLDRSKQGVAPRTCLSTRPVKPRPQPPLQNGQAGHRGSPGMRTPPNGPKVALAVQAHASFSPNGAPALPETSMQQRPQSPVGSMSSMESQQSGRSNPNVPPTNLAQRARSNSSAPSKIPQAQPRSRSNSSAQMAAPTTAQPGPSPMNPMPKYVGGSTPKGAPTRKPVPGQAL
ncbi:SH3 domain protein [Diplocarpon rosae]|nr:SH3 domain protein [Diplocarpon rosae]